MITFSEALANIVKTYYQVLNGTEPAAIRACLDVLCIVVCGMLPVAWMIERWQMWRDNPRRRYLKRHGYETE